MKAHSTSPAQRLPRNAFPRFVLAAATVVALAACQTTDRVHADLSAASAAVAQASSDPFVSRSGALELQRARQILRQAETAWVGNRDEDLARHLAYLAQQRARTAMALGEQARAEAVMQSAAAERERIRLAARTREAELATQQARDAQSSAQAAQSSAEVAQARAQSAEASAQSAQEQAEQARQRAQEQAEQARLRAEAQSQAAQRDTERVAALERDLQSLQSRQTQRGLVVTMGDVLFATGRAELFAGAQRNVDQLASVLRQYPERRVLIEGFTDSVGSAASNVTLSQRRAEAFRQALMARGVASERMEVRGHGARYPVADNRTPAGRQQNRRVEVLFSDAQGRFGER
jgi:outer membrane protein OmpA-like peptidoglycan-associated protein